MQTSICCDDIFLQIKRTLQLIFMFHFYFPYIVAISIAYISGVALRHCFSYYISCIFYILIYRSAR